MEALLVEPQQELVNFLKLYNIPEVNRVFITGIFTERISSFLPFHGMEHFLDVARTAYDMTNRFVNDRKDIGVSANDMFIMALCHDIGYYIDYSGQFYVGSINDDTAKDHERRSYQFILANRDNLGLDASLTEAQIIEIITATQLIGWGPNDGPVRNNLGDSPSQAALIMAYSDLAHLTTSSPDELEKRHISYYEEITKFDLEMNQKKYTANTLRVLGAHLNTCNLLGIQIPDEIINNKISVQVNLSDHSQILENIIYKMSNLGNDWIQWLLARFKLFLQINLPQQNPLPAAI
jgi:hypothetical protein